MIERRVHSGVRRTFARRVHSRWSYGWTLLLVLPAAVMYMRLFIIQHDCGHDSFFPRTSGQPRVGATCRSGGSGRAHKAALGRRASLRYVSSTEKARTETSRYVGAFDLLKSATPAGKRAIVTLARDPFALSPWPCAAPAHSTGQSAISKVSRTAAVPCLRAGVFHSYLRDSYDQAICRQSSLHGH